MDVPEYLRTRQWIVTDYGIEPLPGIPYGEIERARLIGTRPLPTGTLYDWPLQMVEKEWCDIVDFIEAWMFAIDHFHRHEVDHAMVAKTVAQSMRRRLAEFETLLGQAGARIPGYFEPQRPVGFLIHEFDRIEREEQAARDRWRTFRYAQAGAERDDDDDDDEE